ncbi:hypothetical protein HDU93_002867 [Gonapodya sp. JEL0774]|nr:hypothetical protein HDU93_002867 [Gonapodya sp. JEL0774]
MDWGKLASTASSALSDYQASQSAQNDSPSVQTQSASTGAAASFNPDDVSDSTPVAAPAAGSGSGSPPAATAAAGTGAGTSSGGLDFGSILKAAEGALSSQGGAGAGQAGGFQLPEFLSHIDVAQLAAKLPPGIDLSMIQGLISKIPQDSAKGLDVNSIVNLVKSKLGGGAGAGAGGAGGDGLAQLGGFAAQFL